jgi:hypothetical protein
MRYVRNFLLQFFFVFLYVIMLLFVGTSLLDKFKIHSGFFYVVSITIAIASIVMTSLIIWYFIKDLYEKR